MVLTLIPMKECGILRLKEIFIEAFFGVTGEID